MLLTNTVSAREIQSNYTKIFDKVNKTNQPVIIISKNQPRVAIVSLEMLAKLQGFEAIERIRKQAAHLTSEEIDTDVDQAVSEVRKRRHAASASSR